jgi:energy-coupling factor transport system substrate-specific component
MRRALAFATHALGALAFALPFISGAAPGAEPSARAGDAALLAALLALAVIGAVLADTRAGVLDAKRLALLGVLVGVNAVLRLPGALGGASLMFAIPIIAGAVFGARFAFMLGALSMAASAVITGGVGPWLPFQMWGLGWIGAGGALFAAMPGRARLVALASYGWVAGFAYGALLNLWFWPFQRGASDLAYVPGASLADTGARYWRFYLVTSLAWDAARALGNAVLIGALGGSMLEVFGRARARLDITWEPAPRPAATQDPSQPDPDRATMVV